MSSGRSTAPRESSDTWHATGVSVLQRPNNPVSSPANYLSSVAHAIPLASNFCKSCTALWLDPLTSERLHSALTPFLAVHATTSSRDLERTAKKHHEHLHTVTLFLAFVCKPSSNDFLRQKTSCDAPRTEFCLTRGLQCSDSPCLSTKTNVRSLCTSCEHFD